MKALVYDGVEDLQYREMPDPVAKPGQQLIKVESVGICGSDMHAYLGHDDRRPAPLILGHEAAGTIVGGLRNGERVTVNPLVTCGVCAACTSGRDNLCPERLIISMPPREGAFAQYVVMRDENLVTVPDHVSLDAACLAEPIACGWHTVRLALETLNGASDSALVIGGGAIGLGAALSLTAQGVGDVTIVEPNALRRDVLNGVCGQMSIAPDDLPDDALFDLVVDGVGYAATRAVASAHARPGGVIGHIGLGEGEGGLDVRRMTLQEITFIGTYTYTAQDFRDTAAAMFDGRLGALDWTQARELADGAEAFADIRAGRTAAPKIVLNP
ncbi:alcohol dehydrogenase catalytic domain-containing protein [Thalassobium sp. R2A62]|uniref:alcohol dehydrogenase catalytic domain-containing protein n=1 Tax=Thalassobium sp. R2A62 TaxID=633131 RepID=UPI0001B1D00E|nr:alcohol dehydrogenase catalytic domain-containing protein [Thalassobium sp. R2A62]EET46737.1 alcohol dehydrogenase GroES domain protein [Thalassobium sp. R2A62]